MSKIITAHTCSLADHPSYVTFVGGNTFDDALRRVWDLADKGDTSIKLWNIPPDIKQLGRPAIPESSNAFRHQGTGNADGFNRSGFVHVHSKRESFDTRVSETRIGLGTYFFAYTGERSMEGLLKATNNAQDKTVISSHLSTPVMPTQNQLGFILNDRFGIAATPHSAPMTRALKREEDPQRQTLITAVTPP